MSRKARVVSSIMPALWGVRVQQLVPWVIEMTSAAQSGHGLGTRDLAPGRAGVAEVDEIEAVSSRRHRPPRQRRRARHPALEQRVAVGDPARAPGRGLDRASRGADGEDLGAHALGEIDDGGRPRLAPSPTRASPSRRRARAGCSSTCVAGAPQREGGARPGAPVAEVVGGRDVVEGRRPRRRRRARVGPRPGSGRSARCRRGCAPRLGDRSGGREHRRRPATRTPQEGLDLGGPTPVEAVTGGAVTARSRAGHR